MPTIKYPKHPNIDTAFVEQDDGTRNRALMVAPQDISTLELPNNPNSTKGYVTIDGKKQRVILTADISGGGGSSLPDQTGHSGEFLTTDGSDASWAAVDTLPSQTGNNGKFLTTDGTDASWSDKPVTDNSTDSSSLYIKQLNNSDLTKLYSLCILGRNKGDNSTVLGYNVNNGYAGIAIGYTGDIGNNVDCAIKIGNDAGVSQSYGIALGQSARATAVNAIQIGSSGSLNNIVANSDANTFKVANENGNFEIMSADGTIPKARLANVATVPATAPELAVADWSSNTQTITVTGVTASNVVLVSPAPASAADYAAAGIICTAQATDSLTFTCTTVPTNAITLSVVIL